jgi:hypothetical protein
MRYLNWGWDAILIVVCTLALLMTCSTGRADWYVVTTDETRTKYTYKRFIARSDCRSGFEYAKTIIDLTGGRGFSICIHEDDFARMMQ